MGETLILSFLKPASESTMMSSSDTKLNYIQVTDKKISATKMHQVFKNVSKLEDLTGISSRKNLML